MNNVEKRTKEVLHDRVKLVLKDGERSEYWNQLFKTIAPSFVEEMKKVLGMSDTFGLCGLISYQVLGNMIFPNIWSKLGFDSQKLKFEFDEFERKNPDYPESPATNFLKTRNDIFERILVAIQDSLELVEIYEKLESNQGLYFAIVFDYPQHQGSYTHWISILEIRGDIAVIAGDLTPLGIRDGFIKEVNLQELTQQIAITLQKSPTTKNAEILKNSAMKYGARDEKRFTSNLGIATFKNSSE